MAKRIYGLIDINGNFFKIPKKIRANGKVYHNPKGDLCKELGYYELITCDRPNDGKQYKDVYELKDDYIYQSWVEFSEEELPDIEIPEEGTEETPDNEYPTLEQRVALLEREMDFIMEFGKFKNHWFDEQGKHNNKH